jgi:hypothetical protein
VEIKKAGVTINYSLSSREPWTNILVITTFLRVKHDIDKSVCLVLLEAEGIKWVDKAKKPFERKFFPPFVCNWN